MRISWSKVVASLAVTTMAVATTVVSASANPSSGPTTAWGDNVFGQVGNGTTSPALSPVQVSGLQSDVLAVSVGGDHAIVLKTGGAVLAWGFNNAGQVGDGTSAPRLSPTAVTGLGSGVKAIAAGDSHNLALTSAGGVMAWGHNSSGQLGDGSTTSRSTPVPVSGLGSGVIGIAAGGDHSLALKSDGTVVAWGKNDNGELGDGGTTERHGPVLVAGLGSIKALSAGRHHNLALRSDGVVLGWGFNGSGQLGDGTTSDNHLAAAAPGLSGVTEIAAGGDHSMALTSGGAVTAWGDNQFGQVGDNTTTDRATPTPVSGLGSGVVGIAAGWDHSLAIKGGGALVAWGDNTGGQLGIGTGGAATFKAVPTQVGGLTEGIGAIGAGDVASIAVPGIPGPSGGVLGSPTTPSGSNGSPPGLPGAGYFSGVVGTAIQFWNWILGHGSPVALLAALAVVMMLTATAGTVRNRRQGRPMRSGGAPVVWGARPGPSAAPGMPRPFPLPSSSEQPPEAPAGEVTQRPSSAAAFLVLAVAVLAATTITVRSRRLDKRNPIKGEIT